MHRYALAALLALVAAPAVAMPVPKKMGSSDRTAAAAVATAPRAPRKRIDSRPRVAQTDMSHSRRR
jgi:hypothetical protein